MDWPTRSENLVSEWRFLRSTAQKLAKTERRWWVIHMHLHMPKPTPPPPPPPPIHSVVVRGTMSIPPIIFLIASFCDADAIVALYATTKVLRDREWPLVRRNCRLWSRRCLVEFGSSLDVLYGGMFHRPGPWSHYFNGPRRPRPLPDTFVALEPTQYTWPRQSAIDPRRTDDALPNLQFSDFQEMRQLLCPQLATSVHVAAPMYRAAQCANRVALRAILMGRWGVDILFCLCILSAVVDVVQTQVWDRTLPVVWLAAFIALHICAPCYFKLCVRQASDLCGPIRLGCGVLLPTSRWPPSLRDFSFSAIWHFAEKTVVVPTQFHRVFAATCVALAAIAALSSFGWLALLLFASGATAKLARDYVHRYWTRASFFFLVCVIAGAPAACWMNGLVSWRTPLAVALFLEAFSNGSTLILGTENRAALATACVSLLWDVIAFVAAVEPIYMPQRTIPYGIRCICIARMVFVSINLFGDWALI